MNRAELISAKVIVIRSCGGTWGETLNRISRMDSSRASDPGNRLAVCASAPIPR